MCATYLEQALIATVGPSAISGGETLSTLLFAIPDIPEAGKLVFFGICYFLWGFAYTVCDVPFWGLIGSAFPDPKERTGVVAQVRAFGGISLEKLTVPEISALVSAVTSAMRCISMASK